MPETILHQFAYSHFNEKARWALDYKGISHARISYLPGPHAPAISKLSGQNQTPVLQLDNEYIAGSAAIINCLENRFPDQPLYPAQDDIRASALAWQARLDATLGPDVRTVFFEPLLNELGYLATMFGSGKSSVKRFLYRLMLPGVKSLIATGNGVTPENVPRARESVTALLDEIAASVSGGFLVGQQFTVADLTAVSLMAPLCSMRHADMKRPEPVPASIDALIRQYADHPAIQWAEAVHAEYRH